jgi:hypothetical protein
MGPRARRALLALAFIELVALAVAVVAACRGHKPPHRALTLMHAPQTLHHLVALRAGVLGIAVSPNEDHWERWEPYEWWPGESSLRRSESTKLLPRWPHHHGDFGGIVWYDDPGNCYSVTIPSRDGAWTAGLVEGSARVGLWSATSRVRTVAIDGVPRSADFLADGSRLVVGTADGALDVIDPSTAVLVTALPGRDGPVEEIAAFRVGSRVLVRRQALEVVDIAGLRLEGHFAVRGKVTASAISWDGRVIAAGVDQGGSAHVVAWDVDSGQAVLDEILPIGVEHVWLLVFSVEGDAVFFSDARTIVGRIELR